MLFQATSSGQRHIKPGLISDDEEMEEEKNPWECSLKVWWMKSPIHS